MDEARPAAWQLALGALLLAVPLIALVVSPWRAATGVVLFALLAALNAAAISVREVALTVTSTAVIAVVAVLLTSTGPALPALGTLLVAYLGYATGTIAGRGLVPVGAVRIALAAHLLIDPDGLVAGFGTGTSVWRTAALTGATVLAASLWVLVVAWMLVPGERAPAPVDGSPAYGMTLALVCGAFTLVTLVWFRGTNLWWTVMTAALVLQPTARATGERASFRIAGTAAGGAVAAAVGVLVGPQNVLPVIGVVAGVACALLSVSGAPYWLYATAVTVSVVLLTFRPSTLLVGDAERLAATAIAAAVSVAAMTLAERWRPPIARRGPG